MNVEGFKPVHRLLAFKVLFCLYLRSVKRQILGTSRRQKYYTQLIGFFLNGIQHLL